MNKQSEYGLEQEIQSSALVQGASTYYFLSNSEDGYKVSSDCYSVFFGKISDPFSQSFFFLIYYFPPSSPPYTCKLDLSLLVFVTSTSLQSSYVVAVSLKSQCSGIISTLMRLEC